MGWHRWGGEVIAVRLTVLGSGSGGNSTLLEHRNRGILIDVGLSYRQVVRRLDQLGFDPAVVDAIVITHAHGDHTRGAGLFSRRHDVPIYTTEAVRAEWRDVDLAAWRRLRTNGKRSVCGLRFDTVTVPHDASETVAFRIETDAGMIGFATDIGVMTSDLIERFRDCLVLVLESNHATELLRVSPYDRSTRARIGSARGHLSNESLAAFVRDHLGEAVRCMVLVHLSRVNNLPELAEMTCREALAVRGRDDVEIVVARQERVARTIDLEKLCPGGPSLTSTHVQAVLPFVHIPSNPGARPALRSTGTGGRPEVKALGASPS